MSHIEQELPAPGCYPIADAALWMPDRSYVLTTPDGAFEVRETQRDTLALVAYASLPDLVAACGEGQPWVQVPRTGWKRIASQLTVDEVALNLPIPEGHRYPAPDIREPAEPTDTRHSGNTGSEGWWR